MGPSQVAGIPRDGGRDPSQTAAYGRTPALAPQETAALSLAEVIASKSATAIRAGKYVFNEQLEMGLGDAYDLASCAMVDGLQQGDAEEGIAAFIEKRPPRWDWERS